MKVLLHTCCAPCLSGSRRTFEEEGLDITSLWYNPNIHPFTEHDKRLQTLQRYLFLDPLDLILDDGYDHLPFMMGMMSEIFNERSACSSQYMTEDERKIRCRFCYRKRMVRTAMEARERGFDCFSTTLLLSKHQDHESIRTVCKEIGSEMEVEFVYKDLRKNWKYSIDRSRELRLYRQGYCGCIFSEHERYSSSVRLDPDEGRSP